MADAAPLPPFDRWPVQYEDPRFGYAWYCGAGVIVAQVTVPHGTEAAATAYHDYESSMLDTHAADVDAHGGIFVIHDWRKVATYDKGARHIWQERMKAHPRGYLRGSVVCVASASALLRMAVQAVNLFSTLAYGAGIELSTDLEAVLAAHALSADRGPRFAGA